VYKWVDAQGKVQYGDSPPDGVHAEVVELLGTHTSRSAAAAPAPSARAASTSTTPVDSSTKQAVDQDVAATREKQCADAQAEYKKLIEGRRLYKTDDSGQKQFLNSDEIDAARMNAKQEVDALCGTGTS
jgi:hypothetical protein